jgi:5-methyltetrahydrofolate--homocysteine methyltransferase
MIRFDDKQWDAVRDNYRKWWKGELGRPILPLVIRGADPGRQEPSVPSLDFSNCADFSVSPEQIVDRMDYDLSCCEFYGDSYPWINMHHFGPGVAAAFLGAILENTGQTVWFHPARETPVTELHFTYDPDNVWLRRVKDIYRAGMRKWGGAVCMAMTDLGGVMDILASFLSTEGLLFELLDHPEEVVRLSGEIAELWLRFYREITEILNGQRGYSDWSSICAENPSYMLQCDFCYMIGPEMFQSFVRDDLARMAGVLDKPFYHLDGIGELKHLDSLLGIDAIRGIQWIPGAGEPETRDWSEVYAKISGAGKKIQAMYGLDTCLDEIVAVIKRPDDLIKGQITFPMDKKTEALKKLSRWGAV